jgi:hypothetical protein
LLFPVVKTGALFRSVAAGGHEITDHEITDTQVGDEPGHLAAVLAPFAGGLAPGYHG